MKTPSGSSDPGGVFCSGSILHRLPAGRIRKEIQLPMCLLLARIRRLVPGHQDDHYEEIVRHFGVDALRPPPTPMSDRELARAIAEFLREAPAAEAMSNPGRRLDPSSRV